MKMVWAVVRWTHLESIQKALIKMGERSFSISKVRGYEIVGDSYIESDLVDHLEIKIVTQESRVAKIRDIIVKSAHTGFRGDGVIAVLPVEQFIKIREAKKT